MDRVHQQRQHPRRRDLLEEEAACNVSGCIPVGCRQGCGEESWRWRRFIAKGDAVRHAQVWEHRCQAAAWSRRRRAVKKLRSTIHVCQGGLHTLSPLHPQAARLRQAADENVAVGVAHLRIFTAGPWELGATPSRFASQQATERGGDLGRDLGHVC